MATDEERLVVTLEARIRDFEKNMAKASKTGSDTWRKIEKDAETSGARMQKLMGNVGRGVADGLNKGLGVLGVGGVGIAGVLLGVQQAVRTVADLAADAKRAGVGVEAFQALGYAAGQAHVNMDGLADGLKEMQLRADEFVTTGAGSAAEALQRIGYNTADLKSKLKDPAALFGEIIERVRDLDKASQIRVLDEIFGGTAGEQFVRFMDLGRNSIARLQQEARETGAIIDAQLVARAEEVNRKFEALATTVGTKVKSAILEIVDLVSKIRLPDVDDLAAGAPLDGIVPGAGPRTRATSFDVGLPSGEPPAANVPLPTPRPEGLAGAGDLSKIKQAGDALKRGYADLHAAALARVADLETEQTALGMTTREAEAYRFEQQAIAEALRMGITLTPQQAAELADLATQYGETAHAIELAADAQGRALDLQRELGNMGVGLFSGLIDGSQTWADSLANVGKRLSDLLLQAALMGDGPLGGLFGAPSTKDAVGGIFGSLFSGLPKFAGGGISDRPAIFGEAGAEAAVPLPDGRRIPVDLRLPISAPASSMAAQVAGDTISVTVAPTIHVTGSAGTSEQNADLASQMAKQIEQLARSTVVSEIRKQQRPGGALRPGYR